jgi:hypothetical protein
MNILFILSSQGMGTSHQVAKVNYEGDKCRVEGMKYILLALVYFGGIIHYSLSCEEGGWTI